MAKAKANSSSVRLTKECPLIALASEADRLIRAQDCYQEAETQPGELASVPGDVSRILAAIERYGLTLRAQSEFGALFQLGLVITGLEDVIADVRDDASRETKDRLDNINAALHSIAFVLRRHITVGDPLARSIMYYMGDQNYIRLCRAIRHVDGANGR